MTKQPIIFITGTGTDIGKTFISSLLVYGWECNYWKPIQTGIESDCGDSMTVTNFPIGKWVTKVFPPIYELQKPLSPLEAMEYESVPTDIKLNNFQIPFGSEERPLIIEGAGGVCVPITKKLELTGDLINHLSKITDRPMYVIIVAKSGLGTLNHTLLTWEHLLNKIPSYNLLGCILNGPVNKGNEIILRQFGIDILTEIPICKTQESIDRAIQNLPTLTDILKAKENKY